MSQRIILMLFLMLAGVANAVAQNYPAPVEGDYVVKNFQFSEGGSLPEMNLHYTTIGKPKRDKSGKVTNAVLITHGTTGYGQGFLSERFAGNLFGPGQLLDATQYYIILPDGIGHGKSSRPSDGLRMKFPEYTYDDMVRAQYMLLTEHLGVNHLRLAMGTSMGGMHTWVWGYMYPDFMDALMPLASMPIEIAGRNRMIRKMIIDAIKTDPQWNGGEYTSQPLGLTNAVHALIFMVSSPLQWQKAAPTREEAEKFLQKRIESYVAGLDANDMIYQFDASRLYNPSPHLSKIKAPLFAINSADDQVNPPELGIMEEEIKKVKKGRYILLPITDQTSGHGTHSNPIIWGKYLEELLKISATQ
ncbi:MAG TPA: hypothetical protein DIS90_10150 [Cytophagales bacterium]|nr:hypothetical protein [Cytophagales bacterium]